MYPDPNLDTDLYLDEVYGIVNFTKEVSCFSLFCFCYLLPEILFKTLFLKTYVSCHRTTKLLAVKSA